MTLYRKCFQHLSNIERVRIKTPPNVEMRLNRGERPGPLPLGLQESIVKELTAGMHKLHQYPSYQEFYNRLRRHAGLHGHDQVGLVAGAGIEEFIRTIMLLTCDPGDRVAVLWPTCAMYEIYAKAWNLDLIKMQTFAGKQMAPDDVFKYCVPGDGKAAKVLFIPNPGQPVDTYFSPAQLKTIADWCRTFKILLVVDEAHHGFGAETALSLVLAGHPNVIIMRTFSKFYAAASIRVGYAVGINELITPLHAVRESGEITGQSLVIASTLMNNMEYLRAMAQDTILGRNWLRNKINGDLSGITAYGSYGFSLLLEFKSAAWKEVTAEKLERKGVYVKANFDNPLDRCMLLACGDQPMMAEFYERLKEAYDYE